MKTLDQEYLENVTTTRGYSAFMTVVVLLHGWPQTPAVWTPVTDRVPEGLPGRVSGEKIELHAQILPGVGRPPIDGMVRFDFDKAADDVIDRLASAGIDRFDVVGHDVGAWIALRIVERRSGVRALVIGVPPRCVVRSDLLRGLPRLAYQLPLVMPLLGRRLVRRGRIIVRYLDRGARSRSVWSTVGGRASRAASIEAYSDPATARATVRLYRAIVREYLRLLGPRRALVDEEEEGRITYVLAAGDPVFGAGFFRATEFAAHVIPHCGHFVLDEQPSSVASLILDWLSGSDGEPAVLEPTRFGRGRHPAVELPQDGRSAPRASRTVVL